MKTIKIICSVAIFAFVFLTAERLLMPKYMESIYEGNLIAEYYKEKTAHDVIFIGDCEVYESISPVTLWENYGITSYIRGGPQQLIWQSYYLLEDTLRYEKPKAVVFNVLSMQYNEPQNEAYNRLNIDGLKFSRFKIESAMASLTEEEELISYIFPIFRYHARWSELTKEDFNYFFHSETISHNGYMMRADVRPVEVIPIRTRLPDYNFGDKAYEYLDKLTKLCKENNIELILMKAPSIYPFWYDEWENQIIEYCDENNLKYYNFLELADEVGIDFQNDTYDAGLHMNVYGAEKVSDYLGNIFINECYLTDYRENEELASVWNKKVNAYYAMRQIQEKEWRDFGEIRTIKYSNTP